MGGPVVFAIGGTDDYAVQEAKAYIARFRLTRDDVALKHDNGMTVVIAKRDCRDKLVDTRET